ncbi:MAG: dockerin type I domain-containing protein [Candidatus Poribacteria bacterium]|nr:dockerin type I domain-containing protein [Candidatus Poribacteria bacterium]
MLSQIIRFILLLLLIGSISFFTFAHDDTSMLLEDVNKDGTVNIQDLVLVAAALGQSSDWNAVQNPDVNRDGIINVLDLVRVSNSFGETEVNDNSTYHEIQDYIFDKSCASSACHAAPANAGNLNLTYDLSYQDLIGRVPQNPAAAAADMKLIDPGNPENSFLLTKLIDPTPEQGVRMPFNAGTLHTGKIEAIRTWIAAGAPEKEVLEGIGDLSVLRDPLEVFEPPTPPPSGEGYQLHLPPFKIEPGTEREIYYATQIVDENEQPVQEDIFVNGVEIYYPVGSHHFAIFHLTDAAVGRGLLDIGAVPGIGVDSNDTFRIFDLAHIGTFGIIGVERFLIAGSQTADTSFRFPEGVALRLPGNAIYDLNSHYINLLGTETMHGEVYVNIYTIPPEEVKYEAKVFLAHNYDIDVPPSTTRVTTADWYVKDELAQRGFPPNAHMHLISVSSHMHRHGELFEITQLSTGQLLHRSISYDTSHPSLFDPPLILDYNDGLRFQCTHSNYDMNVPLRFGLTSEDEMCIMQGYYYVSTEDPETASQ